MASSYGGYDYSFISEDLEKFTCNACSKVLRDPHLTGCCRQEFCESCLQNWFTKEGKKSCPSCQAEGEKFSTMLDKKLQREIDSLKIHCTYKEEGCQWVGEVGSLKDHLESDNGCNHSYVEMEYLNGREEMKSTNATKIESKELEHHLQNECDLRPYKCIHCGYEDTYEAITGGSGAYSTIDLRHYDECLEFPLECPNKCGVKDIKRKDIEDHRSQCPEEWVECPNKCEPRSGAQKSKQKVHRMKRKEFENHIRNECDLRPFRCEHCGHRSTYRGITGGDGVYSILDYHYDECPDIPLECPNKCGAKEIKRKDMEDHRSQCPEEEVECPNECKGSQAAKGHYKRKVLAKHLEECVLRPYQCEHCGLKDGYYYVFMHYLTCLEFPLECPNSCGVTDVKRKDMEDHQSQCPEEPVRCPFAEAGCNADLLRCELEQHISSNQQQHLLMVMGVYMEMKEANEKMEQDIKEMENTNKKLEKAYEEVEHELQQVKEDNLQLKTELEQIKKRLIDKKILRNK